MANKEPNEKCRVVIKRPDHTAPSREIEHPWIAILDADGKTLATSDIPEIGNIGYPSEPGEIDHFMGMLRKTVQRTSPAQLAAIERKLNEERERRE